MASAVAATRNPFCSFLAPTTSQNSRVRLCRLRGHSRLEVSLSFAVISLGGCADRLVRLARRLCCRFRCFPAVAAICATTSIHRHDDSAAALHHGGDFHFRRVCYRHQPRSCCQASICDNARKTWDDEHWRIEYGAAPAVIRLSTVNGPVSVKQLTENL